MTDPVREALCQISLCSQNSASSKEECGRIARAALAAQPEQESFDAWQDNPYTKVLQKSIAEDYVPRVQPARAQALTDEQKEALKIALTHFGDDPRTDCLRGLVGWSQAQRAAQPASVLAQPELPELPEPQLLVESAQGFVEGWTRSQVRSAINLALLKKRYEPAAQPAQAATDELQSIREYLGCIGTAANTDPIEVIKMIQGWEADAQRRAELLETHMRRVLEIARTWQPDYATKMDRDTLALADLVAPVVAARPAQALTQPEIDDILNASRDADEGPTQLIRRVERAVRGGG